MKLTKLNTVTALFLTASFGFTASGFAGNTDMRSSVIKIDAEQDQGVLVFAGEDGIKTKYNLSFEELDNMDNVAAKLDDLDEETKAKVLDVLAQVKSAKGNMTELEDADIVVDGAETQVFMVRGSDSEKQMAIEIDLHDEGVNTQKRVFVKKILGQDKALSQVFHFHMKNDDKHGSAEIINKLLGEVELTDEQIAEITEALESK